ncbi:MAG TPA: hypothetical protein VGL53_16805, partial [Bryobacteraceae bacterium]
MVPSRPVQRIAILLLLAICTYLPALQLPFIADDYGQIPMARADAAAGWQPLWHDPFLRTRVTYMWLSATLDRTFGFHPRPFYAASILLHAACVLMLYLLCVWRAVRQTVAFFAAAFFAVQEGHQEAIMWLAASYDLIVFAFGLGAVAAWVMWLDSRRAWWYAASMASFLIAAISKETFFVFALLMVVITIWERRKSGLARTLLALSPFLAVSVAYIIFMWMTRVAHPSQGTDDRFAIAGGMWIKVFFRGLWDLLFPFGLLAIGILVWARRRSDRLLIAFALLWIVLGIFPHSFLTYMPRLASRHTYLASGGLALLFGVAMARLSKRIPVVVAGLIFAVIVAINVEIIWVKKMSQFRERGEPTELLKAAARIATTPITVYCTPVPDVVVVDALQSVGAKAILRPMPEKTPDCFSIEYRDYKGSV